MKWHVVLINDHSVCVHSSNMALLMKEWHFLLVCENINTPHQTCGTTDL